jgi:hypothetical protein
MGDTKENNKFDTYRIGGTTYVKDTHLGPKAWKSIEANSPGRFVDILEAKFKDLNYISKVDINK